MSAPKKMRFPSLESQILPAMRLTVVTHGRSSDLYRLVQLNRTWCNSIRTEAAWWQALHWNAEEACLDALPAWLQSQEKTLMRSMTLQLQDVMRHCSLSRWRTLCKNGLPCLQHLTLHNRRGWLGQRILARAGALDHLPLVSYRGPLAMCPVGPTLRSIRLDTVAQQRFPLHELLRRCPQLCELHGVDLGSDRTYSLAHPQLHTLTARGHASVSLSLRGVVKLRCLHLQGNIGACRLSSTLQHLTMRDMPPHLPPQLKTLVVDHRSSIPLQDLHLANLLQLQYVKVNGRGDKLSVENVPQLQHLACFFATVELQATVALKTLLLPYTESVVVTGSLAGVRTLDCPVALACLQATKVTLYNDAAIKPYAAVQHLTHMSSTDTWLQLTAPHVTLDGRCRLPRSLVVQGATVTVLRVQNYRFLRSLLAQPGTLRCLRELHISSCSCLDVTSLTTDFLRACPHLETLSIWGVAHVVQHHLCMQSPSLRTLSLDWDTSAIHIRTLRLQCPQLAALTLRAETRAYSHFPSTWQLPATLTHLRLQYDLNADELDSLMRQLPALHHFAWKGCKLPSILLDWPQLQRLEYEISPPNLHLDLRLCLHLSTVHLQAATASSILLSLKLPPATPTVRLGRKCQILKGVPDHALRFDAMHLSMD